jgi:hypothetical protein
LKKKCLRAALLSFCLWFPFCVSWSFAAEMEVWPSALTRTLFADKSAALEIRGSAPEESRIVIEISGPERVFKLTKAGKILGIVWAPVSRGEVSGLPGLYALLGPEKSPGDFSPEIAEETALLPGFPNLLRQGKVSLPEERSPEQAGVLAQDFLQGLIRLLEGKGLYLKEEKAVSLSGGIFRARFRLPAEAPLGEYRVAAYGLSGGEARLLAESRFAVNAEGAAAWLARQSRERPVGYGLIAVLIALAAGAVAGFVFRRGAKR